VSGVAAAQKQARDRRERRRQRRGRRKQPEEEGTQREHEGATIIEIKGRPKPVSDPAKRSQGKTKTKIDRPHPPAGRRPPRVDIRI
jgi:hypothetical protein